MNPITLKLDQVELTDQQFEYLCAANDSWQLERSAKGELLIMTPVGGKSGNQEANLIGQVWLWNQSSQLGQVFSSSTIFSLPNGGRRSPDVAWIKQGRWEALSPQEQAKFPPLCPDFVIELRSPTDDLAKLQEKMEEYLDAGLSLGWLIDPQRQLVEIYRSQQPLEIQELPAILSGEQILPNFTLDLARF